MKVAKRPGRPKVNPLPRAAQLRIAKRAQRQRDRDAGYVLCQLKLPRHLAAPLRSALAIPGFGDRLGTFLDESIIDPRKYPNLELLCWNRADRPVSDREAFGLYERNWRFVDQAALGEAERALIERLAQKFGNGVINA